MQLNTYYLLSPVGNSSTSNVPVTLNAGAMLTLAGPIYNATPIGALTLNGGTLATGSASSSAAGPAMEAISRL